MNVLITGGAGFIGSHLAARFLSDGHSVTVFDNLSLGRKEFLTKFFDNKNFKFVQADLLEFEKIKSEMKGMNLVCHLAANSDISNNTKTDIDLKNGTLATYNVLEAMRLNQVKQIIFSSSSAVYGEAETKPTPETYGPLLPISFYGASKLSCEALCMAFAHNFGMQALVYRFANIVGSNSTHGAIFDFIQRLKQDPKTLKVLGDGSQRKSYLHVEDCVTGMIYGFNHADKSLECQIFNLASEGVTQVRFIAETVVSKFEKQSKIKSSLEYGTQDRGWTGDVPYTHLDGTKLKKLGWKAKLASNEAVEKAIDENIS